MTTKIKEEEIREIVRNLIKRNTRNFGREDYKRCKYVVSSSLDKLERR